MDWSSLGAVGFQLLKFLLPVFSSILVVVLTALVKRWVDKMGLDRSERIDSFIDKYVKIAVDSAEKISSSKLTAEIKGNDKLRLAVSTVLEELEQSGLKGVGEDLIKARIEAYLQSKEGLDLKK